MAQAKPQAQPAKGGKASAKKSEKEKRTKQETEVGDVASAATESVAGNRKAKASKKQVLGGVKTKDKAVAFVQPDPPPRQRSKGKKRKKSGDVTSVNPVVQQPDEPSSQGGKGKRQKSGDGTAVAAVVQQADELPSKGRKEKERKKSGDGTEGGTLPQNCASTIQDASAGGLLADGRQAGKKRTKGVTDTNEQSEAPRSGTKGKKASKAKGKLEGQAVASSEPAKVKKVKKKDKQIGSKSKEGSVVANGDAGAKTSKKGAAAAPGDGVKESVIPKKSEAKAATAEADPPPAADGTAEPEKELPPPPAGPAPEPAPVEQGDPQRAPLLTAGLEKKHVPANQGKGGSAANAFRRVKAEDWLQRKGAWDNSYVGTFGSEGWGYKAQEVLGSVQGKDFRHEKTKKKRGTYRGGQINVGAVNSHKFASDDEN